jgi:VWFA-related protein
MKRALHIAFVFLFLSSCAVAQSQSWYQEETPLAGSMDARQHITLFTEFNLWRIGDGNPSPLEGPSGSVSKLDLKAPAKARGEYSKGYVLWQRKDLSGAIQHLTAAISDYPFYVAARNALGMVYLKLGQNDQARDQFAKAVSLDDHLPGSYLNLGCAQLALKDYASAEQSVEKASALAPVDLQLATALAYTQLLNHDYTGVIATEQKVHARKHEGAALIHYYAAAAWQSLNKLPEAEEELETFLREDPKSPGAEPAREVLKEIREYQVKEAEQKRHQPELALAAASQATPVEQAPRPEQIAAMRQLAKEESKEESQITEAETADPACANCNAPAATGGAMAVADADPGPLSSKISSAAAGQFSMHKTVDEVEVLFAATDHGKPVIDLSRKDVRILDDQKPPLAITGFRNEDSLPLRLGIVIDTSGSVKGRFSFEQRAAEHFLQDVVTHKDDLAFVVGVSSSVLLVQDFTNNQQQLSHAVDQLAPGGGTALWDAVAYASQKLASPETQPVARVLVVISDGKDNSSQATLKDAIESAEKADVFVYTVSSTEITYGHEPPPMDPHVLIGDRALQLLAERTGGTAVDPRTFGGLDRELDEVQRAIRSRYLISYKPASFNDDGKYREISISVEQSGHKLKVYARKGYYAPNIQP